MAKITIYTKPGCPYCHRAMDLLERKGATFEEISAAHDAKLKAQMVERSGGRRTYPQIFIGERHIGGSDDLHDLDRAGGLDPLLAR